MHCRIVYMQLGIRLLLCIMLYHTEWTNTANFSKLNGCRVLSTSSLRCSTGLTGGHRKYQENIPHPVTLLCPACTVYIKQDGLMLFTPNSDASISMTQKEE